MLSPAEQDLVRRDAQLPGLARLLDAEAFRDALQAAADVPIASAQLRYLRYKPQQNCLAAYTLKVAGKEVEVHAKAYRPEDLTKLAKAEARQQVAGPLGDGRFVWARPGIEVCVFPNDNKLASLRLLADGTQREDFLQRHLPTRPDLWRSSIRTLAYKPERRWVGALEVNGEPQAVCKLYGESTFETARLRAKQFASGEVLQLAPLIGRSKGRHALFFNWQNGEVLSQSILKPRFEAALLQPVGAALREFQRQDIPAISHRSVDGIARATMDLGEFIGFLLPSVRPRARAVAERLAGAISALPAGNTTLHGDFYAKQILLAGARVTVLDLDESARGDALTDLGSFIAHLEREVILERITPEQRDTLRGQLIAGYREAGGSVDEDRLKLHTAERLFARAVDFFRTHDEHWPQRTEALLARGEALLTASHGGCKPRPLLDPRLPLLETALSPLAIEPRLMVLLRQRAECFSAVHVNQITLRRHKPGRRALIEYGLEFQHAGTVESLRLLGKLQRRGVDAENLSQCRELSTGRFAATSPDGIAIPEVMGAIPEIGMSFQRCVAGRPLAELLPTVNGSRAARRAADAIARLHHSELLPGPTHTITDELEILATRLAAVAEVKPRWATRLAALLDRCRELAGGLPIVSPRPIHRDFYHDQLLLEGERVWLLDLDLLCAGDPALDAGNFVGHLLEWGVRSSAERAALDEAATAFSARFLELHRDISAAAVERYATLTLARHVSISTQFADRALFTEQILELCEERCALATESNRGTLIAAPIL